MSDEAEVKPNDYASGSLHFNETPWYPLTITLEQPVPLTVTLYADGRWEGSIEGLRAALSAGKSFAIDPLARMVLWLILRQMEADKRFW